jgi:glutamate racemase
MKIGVFDSGVGGLTVLGELFKQLPAADYIYLGDTARLPYGAKSQATIARYAVSIARFLVEKEGADFLVIACNTATALALEDIKCAVNVPVLGVIEAGANAAQIISTSKDVLVIATDATIKSHAYAAACAQRGLRAFEKACPLLVPLVEEGWIDHPVTHEVLRIYLSELLDQAGQASLTADTLVLGCTHYPLLHQQIQRVVPSLCVIDSSAVLATQMVELLGEMPSEQKGTRKFYATDSVEKFRQLGERFLGQPIDAVGFVDLGE